MITITPWSRTVIRTVRVGLIKNHRILSESGEAKWSDQFGEVAQEILSNRLDSLDRQGRPLLAFWGTGLIVLELITPKPGIWNLESATLNAQKRS